MARAADVAGVEPSDLQRFADLYAATNPAVIRCGWGLERNRNGGSAVAAVLALPAVAGKFGVRGGGFSMSNSAAFGIKAAAWMNDTPEPPTRIVNMNKLGDALVDYKDPAVEMLFVYNCNPLATMPNQNRVLEGLRREDLFTVVFEQVVHRHRPLRRRPPARDDVRRELRHRAEAMGRSACSSFGRRSSPWAKRGPIRRCSPTSASASASARRRRKPTRSSGSRAELPPAIGSELLERGAATPPFGGRPIQFVDVFPLTPDRKIDLFPEALEAQAPAGLYAFQPDPATDEYPLALISPASEKTVSSTLGELRERPGMLQMHPSDAAERGLATDDPVRIFNDLGEVHCPVAVTPNVRPGTVSLSKGLWRKSTFNGSTSNALSPDTLTDLGGGACFNDARVQVTSLGRH